VARGCRWPEFGGPRPGRFRARRHLAPHTRVPPLNGLAPSPALAGTDLAQMQHLGLNDAVSAATAVLHHAPLGADIAVLLAPIASQEHGPKFWVRTVPRAWAKLTTTETVARRPLHINHLGRV